MVNSISLNAHNYSGIISGSSGKLYVPVSPNSVIYSHFDHISGVAAKANQTGVSVSKIQILNSLLNQLISMQNMPKPDAESQSADNIDSLIKNYQEKIQKNIQTAQITGYGLAGTTPQPGALFSLDV
ncbi:MAG: hypothetical protein IJ312_05215 [Treponema sp.]|nr:hypothetical protein [Treponema sp.]